MAFAFFNKFSEGNIAEKRSFSEDFLRDKNHSYMVGKCISKSVTGAKSDTERNYKISSIVYLDGKRRIVVHDPTSGTWKLLSENESNEHYHYISCD
jgi:hypothetical protein